jgi:hypothetical protein
LVIQIGFPNLAAELWITGPLLPEPEGNARKEKKRLFGYCVSVAMWVRGIGSFDK